MKQLYRSKTNRVIAGVCGGLGEYLGIDANVIRLVAVFLLIVTGFVPVGVMYLIAAIIVPEHNAQ